tara:strand:- start:78 stop:1151 length:1074 start_codon:yes stop_codon:yes gene_type:complete
MALPNPALTFEQTAIFTPASATVADVLLAVVAAFDSLTVNQWTAVRTKGETAAQPAIRITAPASSPISNFNAILGAPNAAGSYKHASYRDHTHTIGTDNTYAVNGPLWLAIGPDGYDEATAPTDWTTGLNAFGAGKRESGFWTAADNSSTSSAITKLWLVVSAETCAICFRYATDDKCAFMYFGAIVEGVNAANVEADDRLYGMCTPGATNVQPMNYYWSYQATLQSDAVLGHYAHYNVAHSGVFDPTSAGAAAFPATISKRGSGLGNAQRIFSTELFDGGLASVPIESWRVRNAASPTTTAPNFAGYCGRLRGVYHTVQGTARSVLLDSAAAVKGYRMSGSLTSSTYDAIIFGNEG